MDLSLDDIIKKNNIKKGPQKARGRQQNAVNSRRNNSSGKLNKPLQNSNGRINKDIRRLPQERAKIRNLHSNKSGIGRQPPIADARFKIIQKNRRRLSDARDKLTEIAKLSDARAKIKGRYPKGFQGNFAQDQRQMQRKNLNRINSRPSPLLQRSFRNNTFAGPALESGLLRCTINRSPSDFPLPLRFDEEEGSQLSGRLRNDLSSIKVVTQNDYNHYSQEYYPSVPEPMYVDSYDPPIYSRHHESPRVLIGRSSGARMSQEMRARLDSPVSYTPLPAPQPAQGHRIVVSNLHSSVTHEDIKELFEDIGPLLTSRLVRAGTAEVIYKFQKDAKKAVEAYHNRQLDGQPMKCLLVNPRPPTAPGSGVLRSNNIPVSPKYPSSSKSMVVPDLSAIHKALFTSK